ncbi:ligase-associated DNA damage response endonuclease PdeM [Solitalea longa]|uniref:ligase-associated DNA damage response endonuclease PdeM n=1 Tax=Solitalea longa TaxID=2079460 RepID=UPI0013FE08C1|nr:ligase-associated DNA damage response endonuclease PdeM [Solitalea longa]
MTITICDQTLQLLPQKALFWVEEQTLLISDLHIGKIAHFRKAGYAVPSNSIQQNFERLNQLMAFCNPKRIYFIGDLFHSDINHEWELFLNWRKQFLAIDMQIILGNHDRLPSNFNEDFKITVHQTTIKVGPFTLAHQPVKSFSNVDEYVISGHIHPVVKITGKANQAIKLPCFIIGKQQAILPGFGYFTGGHALKTTSTDKIFAIVEHELKEV